MLFSEQPKEGRTRGPTNWVKLRHRETKGQGEPDTPAPQKGVRRQRRLHGLHSPLPALGLQQQQQQQTLPPARRHAHTGMRAPFPKRGNRGTSLPVTCPGCQSQADDEAGRAAKSGKSQTHSSQPPGLALRPCLPQGCLERQRHFLPGAQMVPVSLSGGVCSLPSLFFLLAFPPPYPPPPNPMKEQLPGWPLKTKGAAVSQPCGSPATRAGGYGNELVCMQMRRLGDLHGAGLGRAKVEQVGEAAGNSLPAPGAGLLPGSRPGGREGGPARSGLCSLRHLGSCWGLISPIYVNKINLLVGTSWCKRTAGWDFGGFFLIKFGG